MIGRAQGSALIACIAFTVVRGIAALPRGSQAPADVRARRRPPPSYPADEQARRMGFPEPRAAPPARGGGPPPGTFARSRPPTERESNGVLRKQHVTVSYLLVLSTFLVFGAQHLKWGDVTHKLALDHYQPRAWQFLTALFCHSDLQHLMGNAFTLLVFGKLVEEDLGPIALLLSFLVCGGAASFVSLLMLPRNVRGMGASGAIFGLFAVAVLGKLLPGNGRSFSWRDAVDVAVFGSYAAYSLVAELQMLASGELGPTNHAAHIGGVLAGALLALLMRKVLPGGTRAGRPQQAKGSRFDTYDEWD